jgi:transposase
MREYKAEAVKMLTQQGISSAEAGRQLGVNSNLILRWKQELVAEGSNAFPGHGNRPHIEKIGRRFFIGAASFLTICLRSAD